MQPPGSQGQVCKQGNAKGTNTLEAKQPGPPSRSSSRNADALLISYQATALAFLSPGPTYTARVPIAHNAAWSAQWHAEAFPPGQ